MNIKTRKYYAYTYGPNIKLAELGLTPGVAVKFGETTKQTVDKRMKQQGGTNEGFEKVKLQDLVKKNQQVVSLDIIEDKRISSISEFHKINILFPGLLDMTTILLVPGKYRLSGALNGNLNLFIKLPFKLKTP